MNFFKVAGCILAMGLFLCLPALGFPDDPSPTPTATDTYSQGLALFQQKQYAPAIAVFEQALQEKPGDAHPYYYLAYSQYRTGEFKEADLNFYRLCQKEQAPSIRAFADKIKDRLSPEDQEWVEQQLRADAAADSIPPPPDSGSQAGPNQGVTSVEAAFHPFGVRLTTGLSFPNFGDFYTEKDALTTVAQYDQTMDPSLTYDQSIPWALAYLQLTPFFTLGDFEFGGRVTYFFPTSATYYRANSFGYSVNFSANLSTFSTDLVSRIYVPLDKGSQFFIEPSLGYQPLHMVFTIANVGTSANPPNSSYGFDADGSTLDAGLNTGFLFKTKGGFTISLSGGYEFASIQNLAGTFFDTGNPARNGIQGTAVMAYNSYWNKSLIWFLPNDPGYDYLFYSATSTAQNTRPLAVDFSGVRLALDLAYAF